MQRNSEREILEKIMPGKRVSENENFKGENPEEKWGERVSEKRVSEKRAREDVISGGAFQ